MGELIFGKIDIINDFGNYAITDTTERNDFIQKMTNLIKPDCPTSLNKLYAAFKAAVPFLKNPVNDVFNNVKNTLVNASFLSGLIILIFIFLSSSVSLVFMILFTLAYICIWIFLLFWNVKFTDLLEESLSGDLKNESQFMIISILAVYNSIFSRIQSQSKDAVC